jgi:VanZ family protein
MVFTFTHIPQQALPVLLQMNGLDKVLHALAYGIITLLFILSFRVSHNSIFNLIPLFTILAFAAVDEVTQNFVGRTASLYDWIADFAGIVFAQSIFLYHNRTQSRVSLNKSF